MNFLGLKEDCETLLSRFQATDSVRYEEFLSIWKEMQFHTIFFGGMRNLESNRFAREAFAVVSPYFLPPYTFQIRVGALYLMYGLYNTQLCEPKQKIRIALKDWPEVEKFNQDLISAQHLDAVYIFRQMRRCRAFYFTAMPTVLTFRPQWRIPTEVGKEEFKDVRNRVADLVTMESLEEMVNIHEHYQKIKSMINPEKSEPDKSLNLLKDEFTDNLNFLVSQYQHWRQVNRQPPRTKCDEENAGTSQESEGSERARILAAIKSKSYTSVTQAVKSRRHRQVQLASSESGSDCKSTKAERMRAKRLRYKADKEKQKQAYLSLTTKKRKTANMPSISEENSSSSSEEVPVKKRKKKH